MRKLAIVVALSSTAIASPALARDGAWYVGGDFGAMIVEDVGFDFGLSPTVPSQPLSQVVLNHDYGYDGALFAGYDFGGFRLEAEVAYKRARVDDIEAVITLPGQNTPGSSIQPDIFPAGGGSSSALSFMINGMLDFGDDDGVSGFVGGGVGVARIDYDNVRAFANQGAFVDDSDSGFAWQVIAGVRQAITDNLDVTVRYRFFNVEGVNTVDFRGFESESRFRSHSLLGGLTFNFGAPPPPPPPPPPPAPPAPPPPAPPAPPPPPACAPGPYIVFFDWDKSDITPQASAILDNAAAQYAQCGQARVVIAGHADRSGSADYNVGLSQRRADNVAGYLEGRGIPRSVMTTEAFGESRPLVETADGVREPQNRRVEITYGPGSGW